MHIMIALVAAFVLASTTGCGIFGLQESFYADYGVRELNLDPKAPAAKLQEKITKTSANPDGLIDSKCFKVPLGTSDESECQQQRNAAMATLLRTSDDMCQAHLKTIFGNDASVNIFTGSLANLAAGAGAGVAGSAAKTALAAVTIFMNAERSLVNETIYKNLLVTAVTGKIREARETKATVMIPGKFKEKMDDYPMLMVLYDVVGYHYTCSFMFGLEKALKEGMQPTTEAKKLKLDQERQLLEVQLNNRIRGLKDADPKITNTEIEADTLVQGLRERGKAIDAEQVNFIKGPK